MSERRRLPNRRLCESFTFELNGLRFTASVGRFADGRVGELFLNNHKSGNQSDTNARDAAILLSFALQHGADIAEIRKALCRNSAGRALGADHVLRELRCAKLRARLMVNEIERMTIALGAGLIDSGSASLHRQHRRCRHEQ